MHNQNDLEAFQERVALYALGALLPFEEGAFADELAMASDEMRAEVAQLKAIVSLIGLQTAPAVPCDKLRDQLLERIAHEPQTQFNPVTHLDIFAHAGQWKPLFDGGLCKVLFTEPTNGYVTSLLQVEPGKRLPNHHHKGNEQCLIVAGEFAMNGKVYRPGDFTVAFAGSDHLEIYTETGGMLLLISPPDYIK